MSKIILIVMYTLNIFYLKLVKLLLHLFLPSNNKFYYNHFYLTIYTQKVILDIRNSLLFKYVFKFVFCINQIQLAYCDYIYKRLMVKFFSH